jgi:hypothetical protein
MAYTTIFYLVKHKSCAIVIPLADLRPRGLMKAVVWDRAADVVVTFEMQRSGRKVLFDRL